MQTDLSKSRAAVSLLERQIGHVFSLVQCSTGGTQFPELNADWRRWRTACLLWHLYSSDVACMARCESWQCLRLCQI